MSSPSTRSSAELMGTLSRPSGRISFNIVSRASSTVIMGGPGASIFLLMEYQVKITIIALRCKWGRGPRDIRGERGGRGRQQRASLMPGFCLRQKDRKRENKKGAAPFWGRPLKDPRYQLGMFL